MGPAEVINLLRTSLDYDRYITDEDIPSPDDVKILNLNQLAVISSSLSGHQIIPGIHGYLPG